MKHPVAGSFRDPAGVVYRNDGVLYRQLNPSAQPMWDASSSFLDGLIEQGLLVAHEEVDLAHALDDRAWKVLRPEPIDTISFPYEWSVRQTIDAALLTLELQKQAIENGLTLRDASAYNVQFQSGRAVFIDTLSFGPWDGTAWVAYGQFCRHFLAPLCLYHWVDPSLRRLLRGFIDGVPLPLASQMLPRTSYLRLGVSMHLHSHAKTSNRYNAGGEQHAEAAKPKPMSKQGMLGIIDSLQSTIRKLDTVPGGTEWGDYYSATNYSNSAAESKALQVRDGLKQLEARGIPMDSVWDLGANTGRYSRVASEVAKHVVSFDIDEAAVDKHWRAISSADPKPNILPLVADLTNPSPSLGWAHTERPSMTERGPASAIMALALIHHLSLSNNTPLPHLAEWFAKIGRGAIVEMVPKEDSQVKHLLATREDIFDDYTLEGFEAAFTPYFDIVDKMPVADSHRVLYVLARKEAE